MESLTQRGYSPYLSEVCANSGFFSKIDSSMSVGDFFDSVYTLLFKSYRNEYIYKNALANKILLGRHSLNTSHMLTEFRVGKSKADVIILNGSSTVYEIKSEYDTFNRLQNQINSYLETFDFINVITSLNQVKKLSSILPDKVGILVLTDRNTISTIREAKTNKENFNPTKLFDSFRKNEYTKIIEEYYGTLPEVPNTLIFKECKKLYCKIPPIPAHDLAIKILKERTKLSTLKDFISKSPYSISAYAISICDQENKMHKLMNLLQGSIDFIQIPNNLSN